MLTNDEYEGSREERVILHELRGATREVIADRLGPNNLHLCKMIPLLPGKKTSDEAVLQVHLSDRGNGLQPGHDSAKPTKLEMEMLHQILENPNSNVEVVRTKLEAMGVVGRIALKEARTDEGANLISARTIDGIIGVLNDPDIEKGLRLGGPNSSLSWRIREAVEGIIQSEQGRAAIAEQARPAGGEPSRQSLFEALDQIIQKPGCDSSQLRVLRGTLNETMPQIARVARAASGKAAEARQPF